jgi:hypothetical protein
MCLPPLERNPEINPVYMYIANNDLVHSYSQTNTVINSHPKKTIPMRGQGVIHLSILVKWREEMNKQSVVSSPPSSNHIGANCP